MKTLYTKTQIPYWWNFDHEKTSLMFIYKDETVTILIGQNYASADMQQYLPYIAENRINLYISKYNSHVHLKRLADSIRNKENTDEQ